MSKLGHSTLYIIHYQTDNDLVYNYNKSKNNYLRKLIQLLDAYSNKCILFLHTFYVLLSIDLMIMYVHCTVYSVMQSDRNSFFAEMSSFTALKPHLGMKATFYTNTKLNFYDEDLVFF